MPPNPNSEDATGDVICIADQFHFSSFYSSTNLAGLEDDDSVSTPTSTTPHRPSRSDSMSIIGPEEQVNGDARLKPHTIANPDRVKLKFYSNVLGDNSTFIHYGKWDGLDQDQPGAYGRASEAMTDYMYNLSMSLLPHRMDSNDVNYIDLGSGTGASAIHLVQKHSATISKATCLNLCKEQNDMAIDTAAEMDMTDRIDVVEASFEEIPFKENQYDLAFSQDAFIHALTKKKVYAEAYRVTKPGGAFVFCDLMCGDNPDLTVQELAQFAERNRINDWLNPSQVIKTCEEVGFKDVKFINLTTDLRISFQLMLKKVTFVLEHGDSHPNSSRVLLMNYRDSICRRITQIERGVFKWGVIHARKPVFMELTVKTPVPFVKTNHLIIDVNKVSQKVEEGQEANVVVVDILKKMSKEQIDALPSTVELLITMSAGLDHIDLDACKAKGIIVKQSGRDAITNHVIQYTLCFITLGLRDAFNQLGVAFPSKGWNLNWNCEGKSLTSCTIGIVGLGLIAKGLIAEIRKLAPDTRIIYTVPKQRRDFDVESKLKLEYVAELTDLASQCDVLLPLCSLNKSTEHLIDKEILGCLKPEAGIINVSRGKVVDTDALTEALENKSIRYAILDCTYPEPLPADHPLWKKDNCFIFPHYATNTMDVREKLVTDIQPIIEDYYGLGHSDARQKAEEKILRYDLAVAHRLTAKYNMDMLVWNHISARHRSGCLITPGRKMWGSIVPEDMVFSSSNVTADIIHEAIYSARPDVKAVIHLHTPAATAVSCLEEGFQPITQDSAYFYGKVATYEWDGVSDDASEKPDIANAIKSVAGCNTLLMYNHGFTCFGSSVKEAWVLAYYFERCCETQLRVMQCGGKLRRPKKMVMEKAAEASYLPEFAPGAQEWEALCGEISFD
ncbi:formate dehydrogenase [Skeletonema marinoi]|uniref:Formate dehydrogenase n=1 Tax=Skeletonema marinoi TaxID=267567 RepID=A0AAD8Y460_9STRA|nr:formate dehydrogenase [Skeletonema marinoi]